MATIMPTMFSCCWIDMELMCGNDCANHASHSLCLLSDASLWSRARLQLLMSGTKPWRWVCHLQVRGYDHVGPYDPEIGAPGPVLKRTGSNASSASRCTHARRHFTHTTLYLWGAARS